MPDTELSHLLDDLRFIEIQWKKLEQPKPQVYRRKSSTQLYRIHSAMVTNNEIPKTFSLQNSLPSLPVPNLNSTLEKYIRAVSALVPADQLEQTKKIAADFEKSKDSQVLQKALLKKASKKRNWMEDWWYDAYNENRDPLPLQNMGSIVPRATKGGNQLIRGAEFIHFLMVYWLDLRKEFIPITTSRKEVWDMDQFHNLFNSARSATHIKDTLKRYFKTEAKGSTSSKIIVISDGQLYSLEAMKDGELSSRGEIMQSLKQIQQHSALFSSDPSIISLTTEQRDKWAKIKKDLKLFSEKNKKIIRTIESSAFAISLAKETATSESELMFFSLFGNPQNSWCDKNFTVIVLSDGQICYNADHCNVDAIALFTPADFVAKKLDKEPLENVDAGVPFEHLCFDFSAELTDQIFEAEKKFYALAENVELSVHNFKGFGNSEIKTKGLYTDTFIQIALQLAYFKLHGRFAPTYETASTRKFYHGRTETVRSCTPEFISFAKTAVKNSPLRKKLFGAYDAHNKYMEEARNAQGIDRHLYGLQKMQKQLKSQGVMVSTRGIFKDPSWKASGGGGNFRLSTSFLGYDPEGTFGYVAAMCPDGYGCFYRINPNSLTFTATCFRGADTNVTKFTSCIDWALDFVHSILQDQ